MKNVWVRQLSQISLLTLGAASILAFQNCSPMKSNSSSGMNSVVWEDSTGKLQAFAVEDEVIPSDDEAVPGEEEASPDDEAIPVDDEAAPEDDPAVPDEEAAPEEGEKQCDGKHGRRERSVETGERAPRERSGEMLPPISDEQLDKICNSPEVAEAIQKVREKVGSRFKSFGVKSGRGSFKRCPVLDPAPETEEEPVVE